MISSFKVFHFLLNPLKNLLECNICLPLKDEKIYEYIFMNMFYTLVIVLVLKFFSFECVLFLI